MVKSGQTTVAVAGTAVQLMEDRVGLRHVVLRAHPDNTGVVFVGNDGSGDVTADNGLALAKADAPIELVCRPDGIWCDAATGGDKVCWMVVYPD